jgi:acyl-CoA dehydrogenase
MPDRSFLAWPFFEQRHRAFAADVERLAETLVDLADTDVDATCRMLVARLAEAGLLRHTVPAAYGGASERLDVRTLCLARETLARFEGLADYVFAMQGLGSGAISLFGSEEQRSTFLSEVAQGRRIAAFALSEQAAGSDVAAIATRAEPDGTGFVLNGAKTWISNGGVADFYVVFARTGERPGAKGLSAFIVDGDAPGLSVVERIALIAPHPLATLRFEDCRVPRTRLIGAPGEFGGALAELQMVQAKLADMALAIDAAALLVYRAAWTKDAGAERITREAAMAKLHATEAAQAVIDDAVQLHGGLGVVAGHPVERLYREVRALRIYEGASEIQKIVIARQILAAHAKERAQAPPTKGDALRGGACRAT